MMIVSRFKPCGNTIKSRAEEHGGSKNNKRDIQISKSLIKSTCKLRERGHITQICILSDPIKITDTIKEGLQTCASPVTHV